MAFAAIDDKFHSNPKVIAAGLMGVGLYVRALSYCADHLTDGFVPKAWAGELARPAVRSKVTASELWLEVQGGERFDYVIDDEPYSVVVPSAGYFIAHYLEFNPTRASQIAKRDDLSRKRSEAGKRGAAARWQRHRQTDGKPDGKPIAPQKQTDAPLPLGALAPKPLLATRGRESHDSGQEHQTQFALLHIAVGPTETNLRKLRNAARGCAEGDLIAALEAARGPGVRDPLAVALAELKKRRTAARA